MTDLETQIREAYEADQRAQPLARGKGDVPVSYEAITDAWLTAILCGDVPGAEVTGHVLGPPDNGTNNRRRISLTYNEAGQAARLPGTVFCKATMDLRNRMLLGHSGAVKGEVIFYNEARPLVEIEAPRALHAIYDPVSFASIVVLEDLGDQVEFCSHETPMSQAQAESQMALLARLHGRFYQAPELAGSLAELPTWAQRFRNLERFHMEACAAAGFRAAEAVIPKRLFAREGEMWPATLEAVRRHSVLPPTLDHGDVHLKNWYMTKAGEMGLSDWGVVHKGHWSRDMAYTIATALTVEDRRRYEMDLIRFYLDQLRAAGVPEVSFEQAWTWYREAIVSVMAFWTITLTPSKEMPDMQPEETSLKFIERIAHAIDDTDAMDSLA